jgi:CheY-like chemotaxis protein
MHPGYSFIVIDDSELDCFVTRKFLERTTKSLDVNTFRNASHALEIIREKPNEAEFPTIILLDLQMPFMNGFEFVKEFEKLPAEVQKNYRIAILTILSSGNNPTDISNILRYKTVNSIIEKPLTNDKLLSLFVEI